MAFAVYVDDSGKDDPPVFVLAGFIAEAEAWARFTDEWNNELSRYPPIDYFKMKEAHALNGQFDGVSPIARDHKVASLASLCEKHLAYEFATVVRHSDYSSAFSGNYAPAMDDPYILMMMGMYALTFHWMHATGRGDERVNFIFDRQLEKEKTVRDMFAEFANTPADLTKLGGLPPTPNFEDDRKTPALQAADLLAWHIRRRFYDHENGAIPVLSAANEFIGKPHRLRIELWDRGKLIQAVRHMTEFSHGREHMTPYQALWTVENYDYVTTRINDEFLHEAKKDNSDGPIALSTMMASQMKRFVLVHKCPNSDNPHLHRRASGACLAED